MSSYAMVECSRPNNFRILKPYQNFGLPNES